jgi:glycosyltransferase involved in cell wall biosynthesis
MKLIIQIPAYNEAETIGATVADLPRRIEGVDEIEYLVVNDGSSDGTAEAARAAGVHHIAGYPNNRGLAFAFQTGIDACLKLGADIIVNTDADNQYCGADIGKLIAPILAGAAEIVIGERPIDDIEHFSARKKRYQRFGSWVVRIASGTDVPDAPSGFRAYTRAAAMRINVINTYTYTLETIIQAGVHRTAIASVPIRTNPDTRKSRLFRSMGAYIRRSATVILRSLVMYRPLKVFVATGLVIGAIGLVFIARYLVYVAAGDSAGHIQSLVLAAMLLMVGIQFIVAGLQADIIAANRKILEEVQAKVRRLYYDKE